MHFNNGDTGSMADPLNQHPNISRLHSPLGQVTKLTPLNRRQPKGLTRPLYPARVAEKPMAESGQRRLQASFA